MRFAFVAAAAVLFAAPLSAQKTTATEEEIPQPETGSPEAIALSEQAKTAMGASEVDKGAQLFAQACDLGHAVSCGAVGSLHLTGMGFVKDAEKAVSYLKKACFMNDGPSCWMGGTIYANGEVYSDAIGMLGYACKLNNGAGCAELGKLFWDGRGTSKSVMYAKSLFTKACDLESSDGCYSAAALLINEEGPKAYAMANIFLKKALRIDPENELALAASEQLKPYLK